MPLDPTHVRFNHACSLEANMRVANGIHLRSSLLLPVCTVNCVQTLKGMDLAVRSTVLRQAGRTMGNFLSVFVVLMSAYLARGIMQSTQTPLST
jgi:hypothetical protein